MSKMRIVMIGGNKTVYFLARQFVQRGDHVTIINRDKMRARELAEHTRATVVLGEGTSVRRLEEAGARRADVLLALTSHDHDNLIGCQLAQQLYGVPRTMALVNDPENEEIFRSLGITVVFSATRIIAQMIDQLAHHDDIMTLLPIAQGRLSVADVRLHENSPAIGKNLIELELTDGSLIAAIIRGEEMIVPRGTTRLLVEDHLILISQPEHQDQDIHTLCGESI
jgi:trk system potassium uptake protein TrkA